MGVRGCYEFCDECNGQGFVKQTICALEGTHVEVPCIPCEGVGFWELHGEDAEKVEREARHFPSQVAPLQPRPEDKH